MKSRDREKRTVNPAGCDHKIPFSGHNIMAYSGIILGQILYLFP